MNSSEQVSTRHHDGVLRAAAAGPLMLGGLAIVVLVAGRLGQWAPVVPVTWLLLAGVWMTAKG